MNGSQAPGRPLYDLILQLVSIATAVAPAFLAFYLLARNGERPSSIGVDASQPGRDLLRGAGLAALIGGCGLGLYYLAFHAGFSLNIVAASLAVESDDHRAHADQRRRFHRLHAARRPRLVAAMTPANHPPASPPARPPISSRFAHVRPNYYRMSDPRRRNAT
jgi:hypothetical protein